LKKLWRYL